MQILCIEAYVNATYYYSDFLSTFITNRNVKFYLKISEIKDVSFFIQVYLYFGLYFHKEKTHILLISSTGFSKSLILLETLYDLGINTRMCLSIQ